MRATGRDRGTAPPRVSIALVKDSDIDLTSAAGRMVADVLGGADTMESELKAERVARAALQRAEQGRANGHVAYAAGAGCVPATRTVR